MRQNAFDHGLLGDALMEQGRLAEAVPAYQKMVDLKPSLQAYTREDVFTLDALAWALQASGRPAEALEYSKKSLREGTQDARLFYHAGCLARAAGDDTDAQRWFTRAVALQQMLLPSERHDLHRRLAAPSEGKSIPYARAQQLTQTQNPTH